MQDRHCLELTRVGGATSIPSILAGLGVAPERVLDRAAVTTELLADADGYLPFMTLTRLLHEGAVAAEHEEFGLLVGQAATEPFFGYLGLLVQNSDTVGNALANFVRYFHVHDMRGIPTLEISQDVVSLGYTVLEGRMPGVAEVIDATLATSFALMRHICGDGFELIEVALPRPRPRNVRAYNGFFGVPVRFGAEHALVTFSTRWLAEPVRDASPLIRRLVEAHIEALGAERAGSFEVQLRRLLWTLVLAQKCSLKTVGQLFHLQPRTLNRRLEREEINFRALADQARHDVARHLLGETSLAITQVAAMLGYSEASAFSRAFRRWSGEAPTAWRSDPKKRASRPAVPVSAGKG
jgi:AraC-like DNA-binding protein